MSKPYVSPSEKFLAVYEHSAVTLSTEGSEVTLELYVDGFNENGGRSAVTYQTKNCNGGSCAITILSARASESGALVVSNAYMHQSICLMYGKFTSYFKCAALDGLIQVLPRHLGKMDQRYSVPTFYGDVRALPQILQELIKHTVQLSKEVSDAMAALRERVDGRQAEQEAQAKESKEFYQNFLEGLDILMNATSSR